MDTISFTKFHINYCTALNVTNTDNVKHSRYFNVDISIPRHIDNGYTTLTLYICTTKITGQANDALHTGLCLTEENKRLHR